jgi:ABC-2 type transport system permease protein
VTKTYLSLIAIDLKLAVRQRAVIFFNYLFPLIFFFIFAMVFRASGNSRAAAYVVTMSVTLGILGNGFFGAGIRAIQEREMNILRRYKVTPITPAPLLVASMVTGWIIFMPLILLVLTIAHLFYKMPWPEHLSSLLLFVSLGLVAFRSMGLVIASVANSMQEGTILVQLCYLPMMFLSGATVPVEIFPPSVRVISHFIPASYLVEGVKGMILGGEGILANWKAVGALLIATAVGLVLGMKLFRWEKEEKIRTSAKLWIVAVILPFVLLGAWQVHSGENLNKNSLLAPDTQRKQPLLISGAKILADGKVVESGAVLVQDGKVIQVYEGKPPDADALKAHAVNASGKTIVIFKGEIVDPSEIFGLK